MADFYHCMSTAISSIIDINISPLCPKKRQIKTLPLIKSNHMKVSNDWIKREKGKERERAKKKSPETDEIVCAIFLIYSMLFKKKNHAGKLCVCFCLSSRVRLKCAQFCNIRWNNNNRCVHCAVLKWLKQQQQLNKNKKIAVNIVKSQLIKWWSSLNEIFVIWPQKSARRILIHVKIIVTRSIFTQQPHAQQKQDLFFQMTTQKKNINNERFFKLILCHQRHSIQQQICNKIFGKLAYTPSRTMFASTNWTGFRAYLISHTILFTHK